jgi:hypothetical protein
VKNSSFWFLTLCALLCTASANGWDPLLRLATIANALVVLLEVAREVKTRHGKNA